MAFINFDVLRRSVQSDPESARVQRALGGDTQIANLVRQYVGPLNAQNSFGRSANVPIPGFVRQPMAMPQQFPTFQGGLLSMLAQRLAGNQGMQKMQPPGLLEFRGQRFQQRPISAMAPPQVGGVGIGRGY